MGHKSVCYFVHPVDRRGGYFTSMIHIYEWLKRIVVCMQCFIRFWLYHVMFGPNAIDPDVAMAYPPIPKAVMYYLGYGNSASYLFRAMDLFEKSMDVAGIGACVVGLFVVKEYVSSQVEAKKQAASKSKKRE